MATAEGADELFEAVIKEVEESIKPPPKKKPTTSKSQTERKGRNSLSCQRMVL
jgi:hypothetical protein